MLKYILHFSLWFIIMFQGIFDLLDLPSAIHKLGMPLIIIILLGLKLIAFELKKILFLKVYLFTLISLFISFQFNGIDLFSFIYYLTYLLFPYLYFIIISNENDTKLLKNIFYFLIFLFIIQIPVSFLKYLFLGQSEQGLIGTLSVKSGSVSSILPCFAIAFCFSNYLYKKDLTMIFLIIGFFLFGIIGEKRAIVLYVPVVLLVAFFIYQFKFLKRLISLRIIYLVFPLAVLIFYASVRLSPSLNPENKIGGSFDFNYFLTYSIDYNDSREEDFREMQRVAGFLYFMNYIIDQEPIKILFGEGPGKLVESSFGKASENLMLDNYGVRYGGRMSFVWILLQSGIIGVFLFIYTVISILFKILKTSNFTYIHLSICTLLILFLIDFITYSNEFYLRFYFHGTLFFLLGIALNNKIIKINRTKSYGDTLDR